MKHIQVLIRYILIILAFGQMTGSAHARDTDSLVALLDTSLMSREQAELRLKIAEEIANSDIKGALALAKEALRQAEALGANSMVAEAKLSIGQFYDYLGVREEAIVHLLDALEIFEKLDRPREQARTIMLIGNAYWYLNQFSSAMKYYSRASAIGSALNDTVLIIGGINAKGAVYGNTGQMDSALILFREANDLARQIDSREQVILTYFNMGDVNLYNGQVDNALGIFHDLESNYDLENFSTKHLSSLYNSITLAHIKKGEIKWAKRYLEKTREVLDSYTRLTETTEYYHNCYLIDSIEGNSDSALIHYKNYSSLTDSLNNAGFQDRLANLEIYFDLQAVEREIERLTLDNQFKDLQIRQRRITNIGAIIGILLLLTIVFLLVRSAIKTREKNKLLENQKDELERANLKISAQSMDLLDKNVELESVIDELKATQQHLVQSEKMASLGTLTAGIAHEINNPLNFISGGLGIIEETDHEGSDMSIEEMKERRQKATSLAYNGLERASNIVKALMTFSYRGNSKKTATNVHDIIDNSLLFLQSKLTDDFKIHKTYTLKKLIPLYPDRMHQVIMNIIDNAIFAVTMNEQGTKEIGITTRQEGNKAILEISNNGPAISEENLHQLFDPFFTTKDPGQGTGLGLSISYTLVSEHNGSIKAENLEKGVRFVIEIPA